MNPLLLEGLDYLFKGNGHKVEIVIANTDNKQFHTAAKDADWAAEPQSPAHVLNELLQRIAPNLKKYGKVNAAGDLKSDTFTLVADFGTFIREEMSPFNFGATFGRLIGSELGRAVR